jgi:hypothetical protein
MAAASFTSSSWHKKLQQQYMEGKFTDVIIRCTIAGDEEEQETARQPSSKKTRTRTRNDSAKVQSRVVDIR